MAQQTAVEWFWIHLPENISKEYFDLFEQAKQMEKEQIIYSNYNGQSVGKKLKDINIHQMKTKAEQYYTETYNK